MVNLENFKISVFLFIILVFSSKSVSNTEHPHTFNHLLENREEIANDLIEQISKCVKKTDTKHATFKGCIDWHSAVHGTWALMAHQRAIGRNSHIELTENIFNEKLLQLEKKHIMKEPLFEMPYGRSWFLKLVIEYEKNNKNNLLKDFGDHIYFSLFIRNKDREFNPLSGSYNSDSWTLINMLEYARHREKNRDIEIIESWVERDFIDTKTKCNYSLEQGGFMAICTNWAWLVSKVIDKKELKNWLEVFFESLDMPKPVYNPLSSHHYGLNFSRSWGLWGLYEATQDIKYLNSYTEHFAQAYYNSENWKGNYKTVGHWVAQFGYLALQPLWFIKNSPR